MVSSGHCRNYLLSNFLTLPCCEINKRYKSSFSDKSILIRGVFIFNSIWNTYLWRKNDCFNSSFSPASNLHKKKGIKKLKITRLTSCRKVFRRWIEISCLRLHRLLDVSTRETFAQPDGSQHNTTSPGIWSFFCNCICICIYLYAYFLLYMCLYLIVFVFVFASVCIGVCICICTAWWKSTQHKNPGIWSFFCNYICICIYSYLYLYFHSLMGVNTTQQTLES